MSYVISAEQLGTGGLEQLIREVELYLRAVDLFRRLGNQPVWRSEA
jgi:hypothetical protein